MGEAACVGWISYVRAVKSEVEIRAGGEWMFNEGEILKERHKEAY
jgi:hypothetical protein